jgi:hypothetical protein
MLPSAWAEDLENFGKGVAELFESRPFWLVTETDVRSKFIEGVLRRPGNPEVDRLCTEVMLDGVPDIDLVVRTQSRGTLAIEFKRWQVVVKPNADLEGPRKSTSTKGSLNAQWRLIRNDVRKLKPLVKKYSCLIVVYSQHELSADQGTKYRVPPGLSLVDKIKSRGAFQQALNDNSDLNVEIEDWTPNSNTFRCRDGTDFSLGVFQILPSANSPPST